MYSEHVLLNPFVIGSPHNSLPSTNLENYQILDIFIQKEFLFQTSDLHKRTNLRYRKLKIFRLQ